MISLERVSFTYPGATRPALDGIDLEIPAGELALVIGPTGSGKSTLLRALNGLVPRFSGGTLRGRVTVGTRDTADMAVRELADVVGWVGQDPAHGFVTETVESELAYTMEHLGVDPQTMRKRVEEILDLLGLAQLRNRPLSELSGGEAQRVAIGSILTSHPGVMVLDEPTSALDPAAAEEVLAAITRIVHDLGTTVVIAEHRLERVVQYADFVVHLDRNGTAVSGSPATMMETSSVAPAVVHLGRLAGWSPAPLSVRDARRRAPELLARLQPARAATPPLDRPTLLTVRDLSVQHGSTVAVRQVSLLVSHGEVVALMGRNGAGKSSLLWAIQGSGRRTAGRVMVAGDDPARLDAPEARKLVGLVPHSPADLLFMETVADECTRADAAVGAPPGTCMDHAVATLGRIDPDRHPSDLSEGEKLGLALAIQLTATPRLLLLDEPTRGLDYAAKRRLGSRLRERADAGLGIIVATHDVEFVAETANRVMVMAGGEIVADGPTADVVVSSPIFAPQVSKILAPERWLTVDEVAGSLEAV